MFDKDYESFAFRFQGGIADKGELNFYELSRSQYAAARLLSTVAKYQESGRVPARITEKTIAEIRAKAPREGSFIYEAFLFAQQAAAQAAISVPFTALYTMVWDHIFSPFSTGDNVKDLTLIDLKRLETKKSINLSREETKRLEILRDIHHDKEVTKRDGLNLLKNVLESEEQRPDSADVTIKSLSAAIGDITFEIERDKILKGHSDNLSKIPMEDLQKLYGKARPLIAEVGLPLRNSAESILVSAGGNDNVIGWMDRERAVELAETEPSDEADILTGKIIQYNTISGFGKFKLDQVKKVNEYGADAHFRVASPALSNLANVILDAMKEDKVLGSFLVTRDKEGNPKSLSLLKIDEYQ